MSSDYSIGSMNQLADALAKAGFSPDDVTKLRQGDLGKILRVLRGIAEIIPIKKFVPTKPFNPAEFIDEGCTVWKGLIDSDGFSGEEDIDQRSLALTEIELAKIIFETCLQKGESSITGEEKLRRLKEKQNFIRFGGNVFIGLWEDYQVNKENSVLERLYWERKITYLDFSGLVLRCSNGCRAVLYFYRNDNSKWDWLFCWLNNVCDADCLSVGYAS
ncbi:MAG: hypothetical protein A2430_01630 [Candidatus Liptonbacteria bacterium RIFOXYC1_FULL_36_8]|uniref:Uncharacterized protein n=3 Tax=Candidatus Liptoniibacteriota TaxID=1817909 RepID=A0A1G2CPV5_9BACT|nr:MAG: hypothetical protein A2604_02960 [Candidatus Liptonbacteria bacterium RIFOXYD1_FULL_36_11]OGZ03423.1 MAG: hypothetical protein A2430_01630 [Candidatus Liptonbacteria bacterium RIFOXYC1_FULL_36_8]